MKPEKCIRIAIAEDHNVYRKVLADALNYSANNFEVVFHVPNGSELIYELQKQTVGVVILDIQMPVMSGSEALKIIKQDFPDIKVIILSMHNNNILIQEFVRNGANAFLPKDCKIEDLFDAIYAVLSQGFYFDNMFPKDMIETLIQDNSLFLIEENEPLSERELDVLKLTCQELGSKEISKKLNISIRTVENHRQHINNKIGARNSIGVLVYALNNGLVKITADKKVVFD